MHKLGVASICIFMMTLPLGAQESKRGKLWRTSVAVLLGAAAADAGSSLGRVERNPLLRSADGRFHAKGIAIKAAISGGAVAAQWLMLRKQPEGEKYAAAANFMMSAAMGSTAVVNLQRRAHSRPAYLFQQP